MTRRQYFGALLVLSVSCLIGGALSGWRLPGRGAWAQEPPGREIRAESFVLVDANGQTRGRLSLSETGQPRLLLSDAPASCLRTAAPPSGSGMRRGARAPSSS